MVNILRHISFARDWLDRAEEKIRIGSLVDGEVYLSLAESEVRKAWEDSYSYRKAAKKKHVSFIRRKFSLIMGIILIFVFVVVGTNYLYTPANKTEQVKLSLTEGYRAREEELYSSSQQIKLINVDFMIKNDYDRGQ